jgi:hypothetical protein
MELLSHFDVLSILFYLGLMEYAHVETRAGGHCMQGSAAWVDHQNTLNGCG